MIFPPLEYLYLSLHYTHQLMTPWVFLQSHTQNPQPNSQKKITIFQITNKLYEVTMLNNQGYRAQATQTGCNDSVLGSVYNRLWPAEGWFGGMDPAHAQPSTGACLTEQAANESRLLTGGVWSPGRIQNSEND